MTATAMLRLSEDQDNAASLREASAVPLLVDILTKAEDNDSPPMMTFAAAGALSHIRHCYASRMAKGESQRLSTELLNLQIATLNEVTTNFAM